MPPLGSDSVVPTEDTTTDGRARRRWRISGVVQGVGFRVATLRRARSLELSGWVRNTADGDVECVGEGDVARLDDLDAFLRMGPPGSAVLGVSVDAERVAGLGEFVIEQDAAAR